IFFALSWRALLGPWNGNPAFLRHELYGLRKLALFHVHHEVVDIAALAAPEAIKNLLDGRNCERGSLFLMKRAEAAEILAGFFEADVLSHHADNIRLLFHFIGNGSGFGHLFRNLM